MPNVDYESFGFADADDYMSQACERTCCVCRQSYEVADPFEDAHIVEGERRCEACFAGCPVAVALMSVSARRPDAELEHYRASLRCTCDWHYIGQSHAASCLMSKLTIVAPLPVRAEVLS